MECVKRTRHKHCRTHTYTHTQMHTSAEHVTKSVVHELISIGEGKRGGRREEGRDLRMTKQNGQDKQWGKR